MNVETHYCYLIFLQWKGEFKRANGRLLVHYPGSIVEFWGTCDDAKLLMKYMSV